MTMTQTDLTQLQAAGLNAADVTAIGSFLANPPAAPTGPSPNTPNTSHDPTMDARYVIGQVLTQYGLQSLWQWSWQELTAGASTNQVLYDMYQTPQFKQRFPAIQLRQQAGLPPISPADYVNYEDSIAQLESQYGFPKGSINNTDTITKLIGGDVGMPEATARAQQVFQQVAYAPPEVRGFFSQITGANGDAALAAYSFNPDHTLPILEQQATAAQIGGIGAQGGVNMSTADAMRLAQMGVTQNQASSQVQNLQQQQDLFQSNVTEKTDLTSGGQGIEAAFGLSPLAQAQVQQRQQQREEAFKGGGQAYVDTYGAHGAGAARPT